jgi:predicted ATPase with chaperone activity
MWGDYATRPDTMHGMTAESPAYKKREKGRVSNMDFNSIKGQEHVKRGLEVALSGNHAVLIISPKGNPDVPKLRKATEAVNSLLPIYTAEPCACGYFTDPKKECTCTPYSIQAHLAEIARTIPLERIAIHLECPRMATPLTDKRIGEPSADIVKRIKVVHAKPYAVPLPLDKEAEELIKLAILELGISPQAYDKICVVSGTIARMDGKDIIEAHHISEAISYRSLDRNLWG